MARAIHRHPRRALLDQEITVERELHLLAEEEVEILKELRQIEADMGFGDYNPDDPLYALDLRDLDYRENDHLEDYDDEGEDPAWDLKPRDLILA